MLQRHSRVRAKALASAATFALVFSFFGFLIAPTVSKADFNTHSYDFGNVLVGKTLTQTFTYSPPESMHFHQYFLNDPSGYYSVISNTCDSTTIDVGVTCSTTVQFAPTSTGNFSATLTFYEHIWSKGGTDLIITLTGKGSVHEVSPEAQLIGSLWVSPDRTVEINPETVLAVKFKVSNAGPGNSNSEHLVLSFSPTLIAAYSNFSDPGAWITKAEADKLTVDLPDLTRGKSVEGTIFFRPNPNNMPVDGQKVTFGFKVAYSDSHGNQSAESNKVTVAFGNMSTDQTTGKVMEMTPAALVATAGDTIQATAMSFAPGEKVSSWITSPDGTGKALKNDRADDKTGDYTVVVNTTGLAAGDYVVAVYGHDSEITFRTILTVK